MRKRDWKLMAVPSHLLQTGRPNMDLVTAVAAPQLPVLAHEWLLPALPRQIWQMLAVVG